MGPDDVVLLVLPLFHIYGLNTALGMVVATGATGVLVERFDPVATAELVRTEGVTNIPGAPPMYVAWASRRGLRVAARCPDARLRRLAAAARGARAGADRGRPPDLRGLRAHRDGSGRQQHAGLGAGEGRLDRPAGARRRAAPGRRGRHRGRRRRPGRDRRPRAEPVLRVLAGRLLAARTPRAGGPPGTWRTPTTTATCSSSTGARSWCSSAASTSTRARSRTPWPSTRTSPRWR